MALTTRLTSNPRVSILWSPVSMIRAEIWTPPAMLAVGATTKVSWSGWRPRLLRHPGRDLIVRKRAGLENQHRLLCLLLVPQLLEQLALHPRVRPQRPRPHREELAHRDRPSGVLGGHAGHGGMVGPDDQAGMRLAADLDRSAAHITQPTHADLGQRQARLDPPIDLHSGIDHPRAAGKSEGPDPKQVRLIRHAVGDLARGLVHPE